MPNRIPASLPSGVANRPLPLLAVAALAVAVLLAYANTWSAPFVFDDVVTIAHNPAIRSVWPLSAAFTPAAHTGVGGRPVAHFTFVLNYAAGGDAVAGYHAVNLAIHLLAGLTLLGLVRRTLLLATAGSAPTEGGWGGSKCEGPGLLARTGAHANAIALAVAGLWLLHPLQTQSVTYVSQRTESLMALCYLGTLYCFVRGVEAPGRPGWLVASVLSCFAGMGSKEVMVTAPVLVLLYDRTFFAGTFRAAWRTRWRYYAALASSWLLLAFLLQGLGGRGVGFGQAYQWWHYPLAAGRAIATYLARAFWPHPLVFDYGVDLGAPGALEFACAALVLSLAVLTLVALRRAPPLGFLGAWFLVTLAPTTSIVPIPLQPIAENRVYLPLVAVTAGLGWFLVGALGRFGRWAALVLAGLLGVLTFDRNADYRSDVTLWRDTVTKQPLSSRAHQNLGAALLSRRDPALIPEAERHFTEALRLRPDYPEAMAAVGGMLARRGRLDEAIAHCRKAIQLDPRTAEAFNNLGGALWEKRDLASAIEAYAAAVQVRPMYAEAYTNLANVLLLAGRVPEAIQAAESALRLEPELPDARFSLGCGQATLGRRAEAVQTFLAILRVQPTHIEARYNLATTLHQEGRFAEALPHYEEVVRQNPRHALALSNLASALLSLDRPAEALAKADAATRVKPDFADAYVNLGLAQRRLGRADDAAASFAATLRLNPSHSLARAQLAELGRTPPTAR
jgi:tetratricopeptide (TPR) repeat protein